MSWLVFGRGVAGTVALSLAFGCASIAGLDDYGEGAASSTTSTSGGGIGGSAGGGTGGGPAGGGGTGGMGGQGGGVSCDDGPIAGTDGLLAYWRFDDIVGGLFPDEVGGYALESQGATLGDGLRPCSGSALATDGGRARLEGDAVPLDFLGKQSFTLEVWVRPPTTVFTTTDQFDLVRKLGGSPNSGWTLRLGNGQVKFRRIDDGVASSLFLNILPQLGDFHLVATYEETGDQMCVYASGLVLECTEPGDMLVSLPGTTDALLVGDGPGGVVDELAIYDRALTPDEIATHAAWR